MNLLEHYIIEVKSIKYFDTGVKVEVYCDCWGCKEVVSHYTTRENWIREMNQGYFMA